MASKNFIGLARLTEVFTLIKNTLHKVAFSGSYNDLDNKPTIPDTSTFVQKSGDTMTGALTVQRSGNDTPLTLHGTDTTSSVYAEFRNSGGRLGYLGVNNNKKPVFYDNQDHVLAYKSEIPSLSNVAAVKDYNNNTPTKFGYSTSGMAQSAVTWLGAWDASVSGEYRLRGIRQADLRVAYAASAGSVAWGNVSGKPNLMYAEYALTTSVGSVVVTHNATGRANMIAFGNGNGTPWFMEILVHPDIVSCVISCANSAKVGVRRIDSTHFAIVSGNWDGVTVASRDNAISAFSVATSSTQYTIDTSVSYFPYASSAGSVPHNTLNILSPVGYVIGPNAIIDSGGFTYAIVTAYNNDQSTSSPVVVYENNTFTMKIYNSTQQFKVTSKRYIENLSTSNYLYALCFQLNTVWTS